MANADASSDVQGGFQGQIPPIEPLLGEVIATLALAAHAYLTDEDGRQSGPSVGRGRDRRRRGGLRTRQRAPAARTAACDRANAHRDAYDLRRSEDAMPRFALEDRERRPGAQLHLRGAEHHEVSARGEADLRRQGRGAARARTHRWSRRRSRCGCPRSSGCSTTSAGRCRRSR